MARCRRRHHRNHRGVKTRQLSRQRRRPRYLLYLTRTMLSPSMISPWDPSGVRSRTQERERETWLEPSSCCAALRAVLPARASNELEGCGPAAAAPRGRQRRAIDSAVARARRETREGTAGRAAPRPEEAELLQRRRAAPGQGAGPPQGATPETRRASGRGRGRWQRVLLARRCSCCCCFDPRSTGRARSALGAAARQQSHQPEGDGGRVRRALFGAGGG